MSDFFSAGWSVYIAAATILGLVGCLVLLVIASRTKAASKDGSTGHVTFYVSVDDLDATIDRVQALGGTILMPKYSPAPGVALALAADPEGHVVGLTQA